VFAVNTRSPSRSLHTVSILFYTLAAVLALMVSSGCKRVAKAENQIAVGWRPVGSWSGRGDTQTDSFNIESGTWRIKWETRNAAEPGSGTFKVTVHSAVSGRPLAVAVEHKGAGHDTAYVNEDPRLFHLVIESRGLDWSVSVEEGVVGSVRTVP
jgi:hypothetical protein